MGKTRSPRTLSGREPKRVGVTLVDLEERILRREACGRGWRPQLQMGGRLPTCYRICPS